MALGYNAKAKLAQHTDSQSKLTGQRVERFSKLSPEYHALLDDVRTRLTEQYPNELARALQDADARDSMRPVISSLVQSSDKAIEFKSTNEFNDASLRIFNEILLFGELTEYLFNDDVEEIFIDRWNLIKIRMLDHEIVRFDIFSGPDECLDTIQRLVRIGGAVLDVAHPVIDSDIGTKKRVAAIAPPVALEDAGGYAAIRQQKNHVFTQEELKAFGTTNDEILLFLQTTVNYGVSTGFAGRTGTGKTADINHFGYYVNDPKSARLFVIEEGSRELNFDRFDEQGNPLMSVQYCKTRPSDDPKVDDIQERELLKAALRFHPTIIICAEMRSAEAWVVMEATQTGHPVLTSFHADNNEIAYIRYKNMALQAKMGVNDDTLLDMCYESIPIMCFKMQMPDKKRRYVEITEAYRCPNGKYKLVPLYKFIITANEVDRDGNKIVRGDFRHLNYLSNRTAHKLFQNGAPIELVRQFSRPDWDMELHGEVNGEIEDQRIIAPDPKIISVNGRELKSEQAKARETSKKMERMHELEVKLGTDPITAAQADMTIDEQIANTVIRKKKTKSREKKGE